MYESAQAFVGDVLLCSVICAVGALIARVAESAGTVEVNETRKG